MTREEAAKTLTELWYLTEKDAEAVDMAIEALKSNKCESPVKIYPDGKNELDPCEYELVEKRRNCTVEVLKCKKCGHVEIIWTDNDKFPEVEEE